MSKNPYSGLTVEEIAAGMNQTELDDFHANWKPLGYGIDVFAHWDGAVRNEEYLAMVTTRDSEMDSMVAFSESWWDASGGDPKMAVRWAMVGLSPEETTQYRANGFRAPHKACRMKVNGFTLVQVTAANKYGLKIAKNLFIEDLRSVEWTTAHLELLASDTLSAAAKTLMIRSFGAEPELYPFYALIGLAAYRSGSLFNEVILTINQLDTATATIYGDDMGGRVKFMRQLAINMRAPLVSKKFMESVMAVGCVRTPEQADNLLQWCKDTRTQLGDLETRVMILDLVPVEWYFAHAE